MMSLSVRENAALSALERFRTGPLRQPAARGRASSGAELGALNVKARVARVADRPASPAATSRRS